MTNMATDLEESDTDEQDRPAPPKRTRVQDELRQPTPVVRQRDMSNDEEERRANEKLKKWQACQVAKGFLDNTINRVLENYIVRPAPVVYSPSDADFCVYGSDDMEDTAVSMAIRNYGLVQSDELSTQGELCASDWTAPIVRRTPSPSSRKYDPYDPEERDDRQDFLERAVAEAIKKKGLSTLSVDHG